MTSCQCSGSDVSQFPAKTDFSETETIIKRISSDFAKMLWKDQFLYDISGYLRHPIFIRDTLSVICTKVPAQLTPFQILSVNMIRKTYAPSSVTKVPPASPALLRSRHFQILGLYRFLFCFFYINISFLILRLPRLNGFFPSVPGTLPAYVQRDTSCCSDAAHATVLSHFFLYLQSLS